MRLLLLASLIALPAHAQDMDFADPIALVGECSKDENQDKWELVPHPENVGEYLFTYVNGKAQCSHHISGIAVEAEDGFRVILHVVVGANEADDELIWVEPEDRAFAPFPPEVYAPDSSEPYEIRLIPGMV